MNCMSSIVGRVGNRMMYKTSYSSRRSKGLIILTLPLNLCIGGSQADGEAGKAFQVSCPDHCAQFVVSVAVFFQGMHL